MPDPLVFGETDRLAEPAADAPRKGLLLSVYRPADLGDCTNGGITAKAAMVTVTGIRRTISTRPRAGDVAPLPRSMRVFTATERAPEVTLVIRDNGRGGTWLSLEPAEPGPDGSVWWMAGGNFAGTSDSRWRELTGDSRPVSVHDRAETTAEYRTLST